MKDTCKWESQYDEYNGHYVTECGEAQQFMAGDIKENSYVYCPYCGKKIEIEKGTE